jgi:hypothetical protein
MLPKPLMFDNKSTAKWLLKRWNEKSIGNFSAVKRDLFFNGILSIALNGVWRKNFYIPPR